MAHHWNTEQTQYKRNVWENHATVGRVNGRCYSVSSPTDGDGGRGPPARARATAPDLTAPDAIYGRPPSPARRSVRQITSHRRYTEHIAASPTHRHAWQLDNRPLEQLCLSRTEFNSRTTKQLVNNYTRDRQKRFFYRSFNGIFERVGRIGSNDVIAQLVLHSPVLRTGGLFFAQISI